MSKFSENRKYLFGNLSSLSSNSISRSLFIYSEHFAGKSPKEVITFINFFIEKLDSNIKT